MSTPYAVAGILAAFTLSLLALRMGPGWRAWPVADRWTYILLAIAAWPWILIGLLTTPPLWYTVAAWTVIGIVFLVFMWRQFAFLRRSRTELNNLRARYAHELDDDQQQP